MGDDASTYKPWGQSAAEILAAGFSTYRHEMSCSVFSDISGDESTGFQVFAYWLVDDVALENWKETSRETVAIFQKAKSWKELRSDVSLQDAKTLLSAASRIGGRHAVFCFQSKLRDLSFKVDGISQLKKKGVLFHDWNNDNDRNRMDKSCSCLSLALAAAVSEYCDVRWKCDDDSIVQSTERWRDVISVATSISQHRGVCVFPIDVKPKGALDDVERALLNVPDYIAGMWLDNLRASPNSFDWLKAPPPSFRTAVVEKREERHELVANWFDGLDRSSQRAVLAVTAADDDRLRVSSIS